MASSIKIDFNNKKWDKFTKNISEDMNVKTGSALFMLSDTVGKEMENYAKKYAPWTDRTTRARTSLLGGARAIGKHRIDIFIAHGVYYGVYLEYAMQKRFAILHPTARTYQPILIQKIQQLLKKLGK